tara:strand:- start:371763 stop:372485 length:723 start_codon:yes stop_codon:yes gene_type:complete
MKHFHILLAMVIAACSLGMLGLTASHKPDERTYTFVYIMTGPATEIAPEDQSTAFAGHFSNMKRMAEAGDLLMAGPYGEPKSDAGLRGLWVFTTDNIDKALEHAATDPPGKLGIFVFEAFELRTDDALWELTRLENEEKARKAADPDASQEWSGRAYIIATGKVGHVKEPKRAEGVLMLATLVGSEDSRIEEDHWMVLLDATTGEEAEAALKEAGCDSDDWSLDLWYGSKVPEQLPSLRE